MNKSVSPYCIKVYTSIYRHTLFMGGMDLRHRDPLRQISETLLQVLKVSGYYQVSDCEAFSHFAADICLFLFS